MKFNELVDWAMSKPRNHIGRFHNGSEEVLFDAGYLQENAEWIRRLIGDSEIKTLKLTTANLKEDHA